MADEGADQRAIVELVHRDRIAFWMRDAEAWARCFVQAPRLLRWGWSRIGGAYCQRGWQETWSRLLKEFEELPVPNPDLAHRTTIENVAIEVKGDVAWMSFDQQYPAGHSYRGVEPGRTHEFRLFERQADGWKIAVSALVDTLRHQPPNLLRLGRGGAIEWMGPAAKAAIERSEDLVIRGGRLRVRDDRVNRKLQAAIRWAGEIEGEYMSRRAAVPVVMEAGEGLPLRVWWVIAEDGAVYLALDDVDRTLERIAVAALVFGLSKSQRQVAELVSAGLSLPEIARRLGVSVTTVRTHLNRMFEKTGARSQAALMRTLLMAVPPG